MVTGRLIPFSEIQRNRSIVGIQKNPAELRHLAHYDIVLLEEKRA